MSPLRSVLAGVALAAIFVSAMPEVIVAGSPVATGPCDSRPGCKCIKLYANDPPPGQGGVTKKCWDERSDGDCPIKTYRGGIRHCVRTPDGCGKDAKCI